MKTKARILCLGRDLSLLQTRCAVLATCGHEAQPATLPEGLESTGSYELVVVNQRLAEEYGHLLPELPTLVLEGFISPSQLIRSVEAKLVQSLSGARTLTGALAPHND